MYGFATLARRLTRRLFSILLVGFLAAPLISPAMAQQAQLAKDIATGLDLRLGFQVNDVIEVNGKFIVNAANPRDNLGYELYEFDPATGSNRLLKDISLGQSSSQPRHFALYNGEVYFTVAGTDPGQPYGIYRYNPTSGDVAAVPVSGQQALPGGFYRDMVLFDNKLYFSTNFDGTDTVGFYDLNTSQVQLITMPQGSSVYSFLPYMNNLLLVSQNNQVVTNVFLYELTAGGTAASAFGTPADTNLLRNINAGNKPVIIGDIMYFNGTNTSFESELYRLNLQTSSYTRFDINAGAASSNPQNFFSYQSTLYFSATDGVTGRQLLYVYGPNDGAPQAIDVTSLSFPSFRNFFGYGDQVYFTAATPGTGGEPYRIDTTTRAVEFLGDLYEGPNWSDTKAYVVYDQQLYAFLSTLERGGNYYLFNPSDSSFSIVGSGNDAPASSYANDLYVFGDYVYFKAQTADYASELFRYSPTTKEVEQLTSISNLELMVQGAISTLIGYDNKLFFTVNYSFQSPELYSFDVDTKTLNLLATITEWPFFNFIDPVVMGDKIYFSSDVFGDSVTRIGVIDPLTDTFQSLNDLASGADPFQTSMPTAFNGRLYFQGTSPTTGYELFYYDPQTDAIEVMDVNPGVSASFTQVAAVTAEQLYLRIPIDPAATDPSLLYQIDLNNQLSQVEGGPSDFGQLFVKDGVAVYNTSGTSLGFYDFATGTTTVWNTQDSQNGNSGLFFNSEFFASGDNVFVIANSMAYGQLELFTIDFANNVATIYAEVNEGPPSSQVTSPVDFNGALYFGGFRADVGYELFTIVNNTAPQISGTPATTVAQGQAYSFTPVATDAEGDDLTFSIEGKPTWAAFDTATGALTGTPGNSDVGDYTGIVIGVSDGTESVSLPAFNIAVTNVNDAPVISGTPPASVLQDLVWSFTPVIADIDQGDQLSLSLGVGAPAWLSVANGTVSGTPSNNDVGVSSPFTITVTDSGGLSASLPAFTITVINVNDAPTISGTPSTSVDQGQLYSFQPVAGDVDLGDELTFAISGMPGWLSFDTATGLLSGTPTNDDVGVYSNIVISVSDLAGASAALPAFAITVVDVNDAPVISGTPSTSVNQDQAYSFVPLASDVDVGDQLSFSIVNKPTWAAFDMATGALTGTPGNGDVGTTAGIVITVSDGALSASLPAFALTVVDVNDAPVISGVPSTSVNQDQAYSFTPVASDIDVGAQLTFSIANKPTWAAFNTATGALTGTPANADVGTTAGVVISVSDGTLSASLPAFALTVVDVNDAPVISGTPNTSVNQDQPYSFVPVASDIDVGAQLTFSIVNKPTWAAFNTATGALTGTPSNADVGTTAGVVISVSDGMLSASLPAFALTVVDVNDAPVISGVPSTSVNQDQPYSFTPVASDIDVGAQLTFSIVNKPTWAAFNTATGALTGTPGNADVGTTSGIVISVSDGALSASLPAFALTVVNVNDAPVISGTPSTSVNQDQAYSFVPVASDIDVGDQLSFSIVNKPTWAAFDMATGALTGTPGNADVGTTSGIVISVSDGALSASLPAFALTVVNVNDAPVISGTPSTSVNQDEPYSFIPVASDVDVGDQLTFSIVNKPTWAAFSTTTGALTGTPTNADVGTTSGIVISVSDGTASAALPAFSITVNDVNDPPTIGGTPSETATQGQAYSFTPTAEDADAGDTLTFSVSGNPAWLSFDSTTGVLTGTPANADVGVTSTIVITVRDSAQASAELSFSLTVANANDAPVITNQPALTVVDGQLYSYVPEVNDPDTRVDSEERFSFAIENQPTWANFDSTTGALTGTPTADDVAEWTGITITVTDLDGLSDSVGPFTITVSPSNRAPIAVDDVINLPYPHNSFFVARVLDNDSDPDGDPIEVVRAVKVSGPGVVGTALRIENSRLYTYGINVSNVPLGFVGDLVIEYNIKDSKGERSNAALLTLKYEGPQSVVTLTPPSDVTIRAQGTLTPVTQAQLGTATATLSTGGSVPVSLADLRADGLYLSGAHTVTWMAGTGSQQVSKPQTVTIIPQVTLGQDLKVEANTGVGVTVPVTLSGPAPSYPYTVRLLVNGNAREVVFESGTGANLLLPGLADSERYEISIVATENIGANGSITVSPLNPGPPANVAGRTTNPTPNPGELVPIVIPSNTDAPVIQATDTLRAVLMPASGAADIDAGEVILTVSERSVQLSVTVPLTTPPGVYLVAVVATRDGRETAVIVPIVVRRAQVAAAEDSLMAFEYNPDDEDLSRELDQNDNGIVDYEEGRWDDNGNGIPAYLDRAFNAHDVWADGAYATTLQDLHFIAYPSLDGDISSIRVATTPDAMGDLSLGGLNAFTQAGLDISDYRFYGEFYRLLLLQLISVGDQAPVVLPLDEPIGAGAEFMLWQDGAWRAFAEGAGGALYSASSVYGACPTAGSAEWQPGLNEGHWCVQLLVTDGGVNDVDGAANGALEVFGGVAIAAAGNEAPVAVADTATAVWRGSVSVPVLENDTDADGDSLSIVSASVDIGSVTVNPARNAISFASPGDFAGVATITYVVSDNNGGMAVGTATVTVLENRAPVLVADTVVTVAGRPVTVNVLANDNDPDGDTLSITGVSVAAASGTASFSGSSVSFAPAAGFVGVAAVSYQVSDGRGGVATGTLTVQVAAAPEVIEVRPASGMFWWLLTLGGLLLAWRRRTA